MPSPIKTAVDVAETGSKFWKYFAPIAGAGANAALWDSVSSGGKTPFTGTWNANRIANTLVNGALGGVMGHGVRTKNWAAVAAELGTNIFKDTAMNGIEWMKDNTAINKTIADAATQASNKAAMLPWIAGGLGLGALGLGGYGMYKWLQNKKEDRARQDKGHIKIRVKGKDGDPNKTMDVMLPVDNPELSPAMLEGLNLALRRNAKDVIRANSLKRDPETGKMIDYETYKSKYGRGRSTDATGTPTVNTASPSGYDDSGVSKAAFWKAASLLSFLRPSNPAQTPESKPLMPTVIRKMTGPTIVEYLMPDGAQQLSPDVLAKVLTGEVQTPVAAQTAQSYAATGADTPPSFTEPYEDDDDDFDKLASAAGEGAPPPQDHPPAISGAPMPTARNQSGAGLPSPGDPTKTNDAFKRFQTILQRIRSASNPGAGFQPTRYPGQR